MVGHEAKLPRVVAAARVNTATKVASDLPEVGDALRTGTIGFDHARVLADAANPRNTDALAAVAGELCDLAGLATFQRWQAEVRGLAEVLDADGGHTRDAVPRRPQLLAEAFIELCRRGLATPLDTSRPPRVEATIVINATEPDQITDTTGTRLTNTDLLMCDPLLWPIITNFHGVPLAVGREQRLATRAQKHAINHRDGGCPFPGCDSPSAWNDTHHADERANGGHTDTDRMCRPCRRHHRLYEQLPMSAACAGPVVRRPLAARASRGVPGRAQHGRGGADLGERATGPGRHSSVRLMSLLGLDSSS